MDWETFWDSADTKLPGQIAIYGAQMVAVSVYYAIKTLYKNCRILSFIVSEATGNPFEIDQIPVVTLQEFEKQDIKILIAVPENHHEGIRSELEKKNLMDYICIDSIGESALMKRYYTKTGTFRVLQGLKDIGGVKSATEMENYSASVSVFLSKFYKDRPLTNKIQFPAWVHPIQAGAALTDERVAVLCDNQGDNISIKNGNYCELTATYWIGRHVEADYLGLFHYRRVLDITEEDFSYLNENKIDVIMPYPTIHNPSIENHHRRYLKEKDWDVMIQALWDCAPAYAAAVPKIFAGQYFYNYNILIAKRHVWKAYCDWLFPILACTEELSDPKGCERADRYIGYLGENLTTLYFMYHSQDLNIVHTGRMMLT